MTNGITEAERKRRKEQSERDKRASKKGSQRAVKKSGGQRSTPYSYVPKTNSFIAPDNGGTSVGSRVAAARRFKSSATTMYLRSIFDPEGTPACQIPDYITWKSTCQKIKTEFTMPTGTSGEFLVVAQPQLTDFYRTYLYTAGVFARTDAGTQIRDYTQLGNIYSHYRVVSMGMHAYYIGDNQSESGEFFGGVAPSWNDPVGTTVMGLQDLTSDRSFYPVKRGVRTIYYPVDEQDRLYQTMSTTGTAPACALYVAGTGLPASKAAAVKVCITMNLEMLVKASYSDLVAATPSISDSRAMESATNAMGTRRQIAPLAITYPGYEPAPTARVGYKGPLLDKVLDKLEDKAMSIFDRVVGGIF